MSFPDFVNCIARFPGLLHSFQKRQCHQPAAVVGASIYRRVEGNSVGPNSLLTPRLHPAEIIQESGVSDMQFGYWHTCILSSSITCNMHSDFSHCPTCANASILVAEKLRETGMDLTNHTLWFLGRAGSGL